ncbi:unnamed protein product [Effrenium voratum]|nr:unnamed protein product [Effrenium voratum]
MASSSDHATNQVQSAKSCNVIALLSDYQQERSSKLPWTAQLPAKAHPQVQLLHFHSCGAGCGTHAPPRQGLGGAWMAHTLHAAGPQIGLSEKVLVSVKSQVRQTQVKLFTSVPP